MAKGRASHKTIHPCQRRNFRRRNKVRAERLKQLKIKKEGWGQNSVTLEFFKGLKKEERNSSHEAVVLLGRHQKALGQGEFPFSNPNILHRQYFYGNSERF